MNSEPDLKQLLAVETAKSKGDNLSATDFKRFEKDDVKPAAAQQKLTKSEKTILIVFGISLAVLVTALIILPYKGPTDCNSSRPKDPASCQILFGTP